MNKRSPTLLHRDNPAKSPLVGHVKVTREDWLNVARDILVSEGVAEVKVLAIGERLGVSRSSFYWYFKSRQHLLEALLDDWEQRNTATIVEYCGLPSRTITGACCNFFRCFIDEDLFDRGLDFAVREWSRRSGSVRQRIDRADKLRLEAVTKMFARFDYTQPDADARARILYYMQLGYHALDVMETMEVRMGRVAPYIQGFTGQEADPKELEAFRGFVRDLDQS